MQLNIILNSQIQNKEIYFSFREIFTRDKSLSKKLFDYLKDKKENFLLDKESCGNLQNHIKQYKNVIPTNIIIGPKPKKHTIEEELKRLVPIKYNQAGAVRGAQALTLPIKIIKDRLQYLYKQAINLVPISESAKENKG